MNEDTRGLKCFSIPHTFQCFGEANTAAVRVKIKIKAIKQYFSVVLFIVPCKIFKISQAQSVQNFRIEETEWPNG